MELFNNRRALPYYSRINLPAGGTGIVNARIRDVQADGKFLLTIKEIFVDSSLSTKPVTQTFTVQETGHLNPEVETNEIYDLSFRMVNMGDFVTEMRNNYLSQNYDFHCVGDPDKLSRLALYDTKGDYRHLNTIASTDLLRNLMNYFDNDSFLEKIKAPYSESSEMEKEHETLAFRIEKVGGAPTGDDRTQNVIQNFYVFNSAEAGDMNILDTQVKYGELYTYNIYAYVLVKGYRYQT